MQQFTTKDLQMSAVEAALATTDQQAIQEWGKIYLSLKPGAFEALVFDSGTSYDEYNR